ncbi:ANKAR protein, partial [Nothoprocta pentlandii]|nr:ANKAR protein [Nothoprocta pentlandii]
MLRPVKKAFPRAEQVDEATYLSNLAVQKNASAFFKKYDPTELQELLTVMSSSWLASKDAIECPVELPSGLVSQLRNISSRTAILLVPVVSDVPLDCKEVHQILRELAVGIYCLNQIPSISLDANYDQSTSCQLPSAYVDTRIGQILISVDYMLKALWHGAYVPREKRIRFSKLWRSEVDIDADGKPQTDGNISSVFCSGGLTDISTEPDFVGIYDENINEDPTYNPNSAEEKNFFMQYAENIVLKLTFANAQVEQYENFFRFDAVYRLTNVVRPAEDCLDRETYKRLQQRLALHQKLLKKHLEKNITVHKNIQYLKLMSFLIPLLLGFKKKMEIPNLNKLLQSYPSLELKTERELPPFFLGQQFKCQHFQYAQNEFFHVHGGIEFDVGTPSIQDISEEIKVSVCSLSCNVCVCLYSQQGRRKYCSSDTVNLYWKSYYVISIEFEGFYQQLYRTPWWAAINEKINTLKPKRVAFTDAQILEQLKKKFGYKEAIKCKSLPYGMKSAAKRGLAAIFIAFCRKASTSSFSVIDESGFTLLHHASMYNRVPVIYQLIKAHVDINQRCIVHIHLGPTALHLAAQCGSIEALNCLLAMKADYKVADHQGWLAVHYAAFYDKIACITVLCRKDPNLLEAETAAAYRVTPLLLAAISGALDTLQYLFSLGANYKKTDSKGNNVIHLAVLYFHTEILKHLLEVNNPDLPVWRTIVGMLNCEDPTRKEMAIRSLEILCLAKDHYWKCILDAGTISPIINLLKSHDIKLACIAAGVLSNISTHDAISRAFAEAGGISVLVDLLGYDEPELQSRCAVVLYDIAHLDNYQNVIAELDGIPSLVNLLESKTDDLLVNAINCIRVLCIQNKSNQEKVKEHEGIPLLIQFLTAQSGVLQAVSSAAIAELARGNKKMQDAIADAEAIDPLVELLKKRNINVQMEGAKALEALCENNIHVQRAFLEKSVTKDLLKLLKARIYLAFHMKVKEQGATALWALAGKKMQQQKFMAEQIGYNLITDMLLSSSDKMQHVGGEAVVALCEESRHHQNQICKGNGISPLVWLLRNAKISEGTLLNVIRALGTICIGVALTNNPVSQKSVLEEQALPILVHLLKHHSSLQIKAEVAYSLACIVLKNRKLQEVLQEEGFVYSDVLELLHVPNKDICLRAAYALALFAYNNCVQQLRIQESGTIAISIFEPFLQSEIETDKALAAFQIVVLAKVIVDADQVTLSARGVMTLVELLNSEDTATLILTGKLLASLAHTRAGIPEAITTLGTIQRLCYHLYSDDEEVCIASANALGYLTFNRTAYRHLLGECRNKPQQFGRLLGNLSRDARINHGFVQEFRRERRLGLPSLRCRKKGTLQIPKHIKNRRHPWTKCQPKDSLLLISAPAHLRGKFRRANMFRGQTSRLSSFTYEVSSDITKVSRPRIVNVNKISATAPGEKLKSCASDG